MPSRSDRLTPPAQEPSSPVPTCGRECEKAQDLASGPGSSVCRCSGLPYRRGDDIPVTVHRGHPTWHLSPRTGRSVVGYGFHPGWSIEHNGFSGHPLGGPRKPLPVPRLTADGRVAGPAAAHDGAGAVDCGADEGQGHLHQQAGPGHGQAGMFWGAAAFPALQSCQVQSASQEAVPSVQLARLPSRWRMDVHYSASAPQL